MAEAQRGLARGDLRAANLNHPFATFPDLESEGGEATANLLQAIDIAATLGATNVYLLTGGRGSLTWEQAAERFADLVATCKARAQASGVTLLVENASSFNADIHIAHTLADTITLAESPASASVSNFTPAGPRPGWRVCFGARSRSRAWYRSAITCWVIGPRPVARSPVTAPSRSNASWAESSTPAIKVSSTSNWLVLESRPKGLAPPRRVGHNGCRNFSPHWEREHGLRRRAGR